MEELLVLILVGGAVLYLWRKRDLWLTGGCSDTFCSGGCTYCLRGGANVFKGLSSGFSGADKGVKRAFDPKKKAS